jgi:acetolactate decarboxylase
VPQFSVDLPASLKSALDYEAARSGRTLIGDYRRPRPAKPIHTIFQVSTSGALVAGVYDREVSVQTILEHGNFGLGTFANLDG